MATNGKVLNLLDEGYLKLQDVYGNVEPFPALVPYPEYEKSVLVYKTEADHHVFLGQIQDFTDRISRQTGKELWTWLVQWEVAVGTTLHQASSPRKRMRLWDDSLPAPVQPQERLTPVPAQSRKTSQSTMQHRCFNRELLQEQPILATLLTIAQTPNDRVPNAVESLYQLIDYYEGDGRALKCAVREEIPSLWDFEHHPALMRSLQTERDRKMKIPIESLRMGLDQNAKESERLSYKERKPGLQPPKMDDSAEEVQIIPDDKLKRNRYFAACFKSRKAGT